MKDILLWYRSGGPLIVPLLIVGAAGLLLLGERVAYVVLRSRIHARPFMERVISLVRSGKLDEALRLCAEHRSALPDLGLVILRSGRDEMALGPVAEAATLSVVPAITRRVGWLRTLAQLALLLGVLGAIANLHASLMRAAAYPDGALTDAVAYALRPLGVGVLEAVPLIAGHAWLVSETDKLVAQMEEFASRLVNVLIDRPDVRLGHR